MDELSGLCRLVVVPKISAESSDEVVMMETIRPTQQRGSNFRMSSLRRISVNRTEDKPDNAPDWEPLINPEISRFVGIIVHYRNPQRGKFSDGIKITRSAADSNRHRSDS